ncbi:hypothetical protein [Agromyces seonyuensis]|uniref:DUF2207 domain-containing protein n=1 Tax=Agromyces seonyuensis TaxID=2662446 RepID=A0A6I4NYF3_9MICO|nr:hypothetical protein [Agromyces seonyuensis]MWB99346.1 hypothetical protein [Agromyces seonyuensis]
MSAVAALLALAGLVLLAAGIVARHRQTHLPSGSTLACVPYRGSTILGNAVLAGRDDRATAAVLVELAVRGSVGLLLLDRPPGRPEVAVGAVEGAAFDERELDVLVARFGPAMPRGVIRRGSGEERRLSRRIDRVVRDEVEELMRGGTLAGWLPWRDFLRVAAIVALLGSSAALLAALLTHDVSAASLAALAIGGATASIAITPPGRDRWHLPSAQPHRAHLAALQRYLLASDDARTALLRTQWMPEGSPSGWPGGALDEPVTRFRLHVRLLPYAVLFGVERNWVEVLRREAAESAEWDGDPGAIRTLVADAEPLLRLADELVDLGRLTFVAVGLFDARGEHVADVHTELGGGTAVNA